MSNLPWKEYGACVRDSQSDMIADCSESDFSIEDCKANARRIVASVNALAALPIELLERGNIAEIAEALAALVPWYEVGQAVVTTKEIKNHFKQPNIPTGTSGVIVDVDKEAGSGYYAYRVDFGHKAAWVERSDVTTPASPPAEES